MAEDSNDESFELDKEQLDSIALETQSISPAEKARLDEIAVTANQRILKEFSFIDNPIPDDQIAKKFVYVDSDTFETLQATWTDDTENISYTDEAQARTYNDEGRFIIEKPIDQEIWGDLDDEVKEQLTKNSGSEEKAKSVLVDSINELLCLHETTHGYQKGARNSIPLYALRELQANWVSKKLANPNTPISFADVDEKTEYYQKLLNRYGNDVVNKYAINGTADPWDKMQIDDLLSDTARELFPDLEWDTIS